MTIDDFVAKYLPLITPLGNGNGQFFVRCHCCQRTSPPYTSPDDLRILAIAKDAGWTMKKAGTTYRLFCTLPKCQTQATKGN